MNKEMYLEDYSTMELVDLAYKGIFLKSKYAPRTFVHKRQADKVKKAKRKATQKSRRRNRK